MAFRALTQFEIWSMNTVSKLAGKTRQSSIGILCHHVRLRVVETPGADLISEAPLLNTKELGLALITFGILEERDFSFFRQEVSQRAVGAN